VEVKEDEIGEACSTNRKKRKAYMLLVGKPERKRAIGRPRHWLVCNIKVDLGEIRWGGVLTGLVWLRIGTGGELL
jgi:hypothetical protein